MQSNDTTAELGDTVVCDVRMPTPATIAMRLDTQASVDHANKLLAGGWGWRILRKGEHKDMCPHEDGSPYYMPPNTTAQRLPSNSMATANPAAE